MTATAEAQAYARSLHGVSVRAARLVLRLWQRVDPADISGSWWAQMPEALAVTVAAQVTAAEMADPYTAAALDEPPAETVLPEAFAGLTLAGGTVATLLFGAVITAKQLIDTGRAPRSAVRAARAPLAMYVRSETSDAGRYSVAAAMAVRPQVTSYYRKLRTPSCYRCALLAGRRYSFEEPFARHPRCDCVHVPAAEADDSLQFDTRKAIEAGVVTGLSDEERRAIVELGADPSQVLNARRNTYTSAGRRFTREGTTRRGVAGARILARDLALLRGENVEGRSFRTMTFSRARADEYAAVLRQGVRHTRTTRTGRVQTYSYRHTVTGRPTPEQILADATSRQDAIRALTNNGYIL